MNKFLYYFILFIVVLIFSSTEGAKINLHSLEAQKNSDLDLIRQSLHEYVVASKKYTNNPFGWSALNYAIHTKDFQSALILANYCKNINRKDPLRKGSREYINALERLFYIDTPARQNPKKHLSEAEIKLTYVLLDRGIAVTSGYFSPVAGACWFNINDLVVRFVELGGDVNCQHGTPLFYLIESGNLEMARFLIDSGANPKVGRVLFEAAINSQNIESIDFLVDLGLVLGGIDHATHAFSFLKKEIKNIDKHSNQSLPALEIFCRILELGANPNFGQSTNPTDYEDALCRSLLWQALELPEATKKQYLYKNHVVKILLDCGAIIP